MKTVLNTASPSQIETECLVVAVTRCSREHNNGDKSDKHDPQIQTDDRAVQPPQPTSIASGEVTGKMLETVLLHKPQGLKAKRLLLIGGGKAKSFSSSELRKLAGAAVRTLKAKDLKSFAIIAARAALTRPRRPSWKVRWSATSIPITTRAIAKNRRSKS